MATWRFLALVGRVRPRIMTHNRFLAMSKRILLISYDDRLLIARRTLLEQEGYQVSSALGFKEAMGASGDGTFDLLILGHSIPRAHQEELIRVFRAASEAPILSLWTHSEGVTDGINYLAFSDTPDKLLTNVASILARRSRASA